MAENLQEYYKRMAEAIDTQLEQKGKAALFYPVGSGSGQIVWAWINAHPDAAVIWVVPGETRRCPGCGRLCPRASSWSCVRTPLPCGG